MRPMCIGRPMKSDAAVSARPFSDGPEIDRHRGDERHRDDHGTRRHDAADDAPRCLGEGMVEELFHDTSPGLKTRRYSITNRSRPALRSPRRARPRPRAPRSTVPARGERSSFSIFIASTTTSPWRAATVSPAFTSTLAIRPGIGATTRCDPGDATPPPTRPGCARRRPNRWAPPFTTTARPLTWTSRLARFTLDERHLVASTAEQHGPCVVHLDGLDIQLAAVEPQCDRRGFRRAGVCRSRRARTSRAQRLGPRRALPTTPGASERVPRRACFDRESSGRARAGGAAPRVTSGAAPPRRSPPPLLPYRRWRKARRPAAARARPSIPCEIWQPETPAARAAIGKRGQSSGCPGPRIRAALAVIRAIARGRSGPHADSLEISGS